MLVSLDPGAKLAGVACWTSSGVLASAFLVRGRDWFDTATKVGEQVYLRFASDGPVDVVVERPQVYVQSKQKGDPNDLITVALMAGAAASNIAQGRVTACLPREWKGSVPKDAMVERIRRRLTPEEYARVDLPARSLRHNVFDAVGIGLHQLGRLRWT